MLTSLAEKLLMADCPASVGYEPIYGAMTAYSFAVEPNWDSRPPLLCCPCVSLPIESKNRGV